METQINILSQLRSESGGTSLVTYYMSPLMDLGLAIAKMTSELATASNIKSASVRKDVQSALRSALYQLKSYGLTAPANGLVLCSGNVIENKQHV